VYGDVKITNVRVVKVHNPIQILILRVTDIIMIRHDLNAPSAQLIGQRFDH
jgi:hypothetical protein